METRTINWERLALFRAGGEVLNAPVRTGRESPCGQGVLRYNIGNIHEIKKIWHSIAESKGSA
ncbi:hypothetical protein [Burkholderia ubonensis]|uniref:hypothetical protein n=1 Tax=Burkholderia ubonensis TaxID=101571 RepID=UPI0009B490B5|nr:hypothetical protein [Burkholderia ubonensis]